MAHTTSIYYRDRLGFEPEDEYAGGGGAVSSQQRQSGGGVVAASVAKRAAAKGHSGVKNGATNGNNGDYIMKGGVYEENLNKFKGLTDDSFHFLTPRTTFKGKTRVASFIIGFKSREKVSRWFEYRRKKRRSMRRRFFYPRRAF